MSAREPAAAVLSPGVHPYASAEALIAGLLAEPWGQVSPSAYETGRLVTLVPWLAGHAQRVDHLLRTQRPDGGWGVEQPGYALVPTLSATEALLAEIMRGGPVRPEPAVAGLGALARWLRGPGALTAATLPDMPAIELIVPALVLAIDSRLDVLSASAGVGPWRSVERPCPPAGLDGSLLRAVRAGLASGAVPPRKLLHALEIAGDIARDHPEIRPEATGVIGASPAATAAWLGDREPGAVGAPARIFLEAAVRRHGGPVPCGLPITVFERGWVVSWLVRAGLLAEVPEEVVAGLLAALGPAGAAAAAGLPADADTTAGALYALALAGAPRPPDVLWAYQADTHFRTWPGEDGVSVTTNAHVLEAFGQYLRTGRGAARDRATVARYERTVTRTAGWLCDQQRSDGSWMDRWHSSPYYATYCCALALHGFGGRRSAEAVDRAVRWVLATQRPDGSWGRWNGTAEETAYAVQLLVLTGGSRNGPVEAASGPSREWAAARGRAYLLRSPVGPDDPPLWHDKDLYLPVAIVRAAVLAALHLGRGRAPVMDGCQV